MYRGSSDFAAASCRSSSSTATSRSAAARSKRTAGAATAGCTGGGAPPHATTQSDTSGSDPHSAARLLTAGRIHSPAMKTRAAVAHEAGKPLVVEEVDLEGPRAGEVLVEIHATGVCHTDEFTRSGGDPEGLFPAILGHEGAGVVADVGPGVTSVAKGDHVIPLYTPECRACKSCLSRKTNLCTAIRATQGKGVMPDGTSRFSLHGKKLHHYMGCSTFANHTVLPEIALAKVREDAPFDKVCYVGCGVTTGIGAVIFTAKVEPGANVVVFGLGGIGLNVVQGARMA